MRHAVRDLAPIYAWVTLAVAMVVVMILLASHANHRHTRTTPTTTHTAVGSVCTPATGCRTLYQ